MARAFRAGSGFAPHATVESITRKLFGGAGANWVFDFLPTRPLKRRRRKRQLPFRQNGVQSATRANSSRPADRCASRQTRLISRRDSRDRELRLPPAIKIPGRVSSFAKQLPRPSEVPLPRITRDWVMGVKGGWRRARLAFPAASPANAARAAAAASRSKCGISHPRRRLAASSRRFR
jgi:hypothetical protein